jgi:two-component system, chemotaxis family, protein-glutamate methylesterase/glutaminase
MKPAPVLGLHPGRVPGADFVAIGASAGGVPALRRILAELPPDFPAPVAVVLHTSPTHRSRLADALGPVCALPVRSAVDGEDIRPGVVYLSVPGRHLVVARGRFRLVDTPTENFVRPAVDVFFRSVAETYGSRALAILLTGYGHDGMLGIRALHESGALIVLQTAESCFATPMTDAARATGCAHMSLALDTIGPALLALVTSKGPTPPPNLS